MERSSERSDYTPRQTFKALISNNTKLLAAISLLINYSVSPAANIDGEWTLVKSPEAWVLTDTKAYTASEAIERFEIVREMIAAELNIDFSASPRTFRPHYVLIPRSTSLFDKLAPFQSKSPSSRATGFYLQSDFNPLVLADGAFDSKDWETVYHEFTHQILSYRFNVLPVWADEGLAELFSTLKLNKASAQLTRSRGRTRSYEASMPAFIAWDSFFATSREMLTNWIENDGLKAQAFYAQAALLAELAHFGRPELKGGYWQLVERSDYKPITNLDCQILLGLSYIELQEAIEKQLRDSFSRSFPRTPLEITSAAPLRPAPSSSVAAMIAIALSRSGKAEEAETRLAANADNQNPLWLSANAEVSVKLGNTALALDFAGQAIQDSSIDPFLQTLSVMRSIREGTLDPKQALGDLMDAFQKGDTSRLLFSLYFDISWNSNTPFEKFARFAKKGVEIHPDIQYARELNKLETERILKK